MLSRMPSMGVFIRKISWFALVFLAVIIIGFFMPPTPRASKSLLQAEAKKDSLLRNVPRPRIIFVGGSNLSFGLNSEMIEEALGLNPINTAVHAGIGLLYRMDNTLRHVQEGDTVVLVPEYQQFYGESAYGSDELLRTVMAVKPSDLFTLRREQLFSILSYVPRYAVSKFKPTEYLFYEESTVYGVDSFNRYGDAVAHWDMETQDFAHYENLAGEWNPTVAGAIAEFRDGVEARGAMLYISFPGLQERSYRNVTGQIERVLSVYREHDFTLLGSPRRYAMPDSMLFNTPYHLNRSGADRRTRLFIEDFRSVQ